MRSPARRAPRKGAVGGFTLVELVVVIVLLGILSVGTTQFLRSAGRAFGDAEARGARAGTARAVLARMGRELRGALPGSVRTNGVCVEFLPELAASRYFSLPVDAPGTSVTLAGLVPELAGLTGRLAVLPRDAGSLYGSASPGPAPLSARAELGAPDGSGVITATLAVAHRFPAPDAVRRLHVVGGPVSFCRDGNVLYRYADYAMGATQPEPASLPTGLPGRAALADGLAPVGAPFSVATGTLERNAMVQIDLLLGTGPEALALRHAVQVRNAP